MKHGNLPIPKLCHQIWKMYAELDGKGVYFAVEEKEKHYRKIKELEDELKRLLSDGDVV